MRATAVLAHALSLLLAVCLGGAPAMAQVLGPFSFTYQGKLEEGGQAYTGQADFEFALFFGTQQRGATIQRPQIEVVDGLFTATLDFGVDIANTVVFDLDGAVTSNPPQIEVRVRAPSGSGGAFTTLSPRQPVTAAPVASSLVGLGRGLTQTLEISQIESNATFQINADINQSFLPTRSAQISAIELRLVNTGAARPVTITLIQGNFTIIATSTATVAGGTPSSGSFVRFDFPPGITLSTSSLYRVGLSTTTTLGARYSTLNPYLDGQANFSSTADLFIRVITRDSGGFYSTIPFTVESARSEPLSIIGRHPDGTQVRILNLGGNSANWLLRAVPGTSATQKLRLMPESSSSGAGITIDGLGRVGIGIETPSATLHVAGNIAISQTERSVSVPAFAFVPQGTPAITYTGTGAITAPVGSAITLNAPLNLPDGAVIRRVEMHAVDNDGGTMFGSIRVYSKTADSQLLATSINSFGVVAGVRTFTSSQINHTVNNQTQTFVLRVNWTGSATPGNLSFRGMTVYYTIESPLP